MTERGVWDSQVSCSIKKIKCVHVHACISDSGIMLGAEPCSCWQWSPANNARSPSIKGGEGCRWDEGQSQGSQGTFIL